MVVWDVLEVYSYDSLCSKYFTVHTYTHICATHPGYYMTNDPESEHWAEGRRDILIVTWNIAYF